MSYYYKNISKKDLITPAKKEKDMMSVIEGGIINAIDGQPFSVTRKNNKTRDVSLNMYEDVKNTNEANEKNIDKIIVAELIFYKQ